MELLELRLLEVRSFWRFHVSTQVKARLMSKGQLCLKFQYHFLLNQMDIFFFTVKRS